MLLRHWLHQFIRDEGIPTLLVHARFMLWIVVASSLDISLSLSTEASPEHKLSDRVSMCKDCRICTVRRRVDPPCVWTRGPAVRSAPQGSIMGVVACILTTLLAVGGCGSDPIRSVPWIDRFYSPGTTRLGQTARTDCHAFRRPPVNPPSDRQSYGSPMECLGSADGSPKQVDRHAYLQI